MARSVLFSNPVVADFLTTSFECTWQSVRPVPQVSIDFGDGVRLRRTLKGNIATWVCTAEGEALDVVPGLYAPDPYVARLTRARELFEQRAAAVDSATVLAGYHERGAIPQGAVTEDGGVVLHEDLAKFRVERPLLAQLRQSLAAEDVENLMRDTRLNRVVREPAAHRLLARRPGATVAELTVPFFKEVLDTPLDDPFLGLAPYVLGGEPGRTLAAARAGR